MQAGVEAAQHGRDVEVTAVTDDSRRCGPGSCFIAVPGSARDGHEFIGAAVRAGCAAVVCRDPSVVPPEVTHAVTGQTRRAVGPLAQAMLGWPVRKLTAVGITGTNGKSTVAALVSSVLAEAGHSPGLVGTIWYHTGARRIEAGTPTPDPTKLAELTAEMVQAGLTHLVMEVSSHALHQHRTEGVDFAAAVFTNLSGDHLDYHKTMADYKAAKLRLFEGLNASAVAVINRDEAAADEFAAASRGDRTMFYGLSSAADIWGRIERIDASGTRFDLCTPDGHTPARTRLIGRHNVFNCLATAATCRALNVPMDVIINALGRVERVRGRLERVEIPAPYRVFVDYAHTDDALVNVLGSLKPIVRSNRIIVVFGCGGDRDRSKRPRMARVAQDLADELVITSDNPRSEDPQAIIDQIVTGLDADGMRRTTVEPDRRKAIELAIASAGENDVVLIAGKGHETHQTIGDRRIHFDDVETASQIMQERQRLPV